jgi:hypothetical protein|tara:strand:+ start:774 stop:1136 length:363 start_codon:yes stop_codon:yes gene_type:complete
MAHVEDNDIPSKTRRSYGNRTCTYSVDGMTCGKPHFAKGLCQAHYMRKRRYGDCGTVYVGPKPTRLLKDHQVVMARRRVRRGEWSPKDAAEHFGVKYTTMVDALNGRTFRGLEDARQAEG